MMLNDDGFTLSEMTAAINEIPHLPTMLGDDGIFEYSGVTQLTVQVEKQGTTLALVSTKPRGGSGSEIGRVNRNLRPFNLVHLPLNDQILADEVQGVRQFGSEGSPLPLEQRRADVMRLGMQRFDLTMEWYRVGALKGIVYDADGTTVLHNFFTEFGVAQQTLSFELDVTTTEVRNVCDTAQEMIEDELGGTPWTDMVAYCGRDFWKALTAHKSVKETFLNQVQASQLRGDPRLVLDFGGIMWKKYRGAANGAQMIAANEAYIVPRGVPGLLLGRFGPADYMETVNTIGLPLYAKGIPMRNNKGWDIEMQSNPIHLLTRPRAVLKATLT